MDAAAMAGVCLLLVIGAAAVWHLLGDEPEQKERDSADERD